MTILQVVDGLEVIESGQKVVLPAPDHDKQSPEYCGIYAVVMLIGRLNELLENAITTAPAQQDPQAMIEAAMGQARKLMINAGVPAGQIPKVEGLFAGANGATES